MAAPIFISLSPKRRKRGLFSFSTHKPIIKPKNKKKRCRGQILRFKRVYIILKTLQKTPARHQSPHYNLITNKIAGAWGESPTSGHLLNQPAGEI